MAARQATTRGNPHPHRVDRLADPRIAPTGNLTSVRNVLKRLAATRKGHRTASSGPSQESQADGGIPTRSAARRAFSLDGLHHLL